MSERICTEPLEEHLKSRVSFDSTDRPGADYRFAFGTGYKRAKHSFLGGVFCWALVAASVALASLGCFLQIRLRLVDMNVIDGATARAIKGQSLELLTWALAAISLRLLFSLWLKVRILAFIDTWKRQSVIHPPAPSQANGFSRSAIALRDYGDMYTPIEIANAYVSLANPAQVNPRIVHTLTLSGQTYRHIVHRKALPGVDLQGQKRSFAVVHRARKGVILDNFSLSIDGQDSSSLSLRESRTLTAAALTQECSRLLGAAASTLVGDMLWLSILTGVLSEYPTTSESPGFSVTGESNFGSMSTYLDSDEVCLRLGHYVAEFARRLSENSSSDEQHSENRAFIALILELAESQVVWAELPIKNKRSGSSMRVITEYSTRHLPEWGALSESIRMQTGLIPKKLGIVLPLALEGHSYHLEIAAPEGMYFYDLQTFMVEDSAKARNWTTFELPRRTRLEKLPRIYQFRQRGRKQLEHLKRSAQFYWRLLGSIAMNKTDAHIVASARRVRQLHSQSRFTWVAPGILGETPSLRTNDRGLGSAHVYARSVNDIRTKTLNTGAESNVVPQLRWELRERPPGILLPGLFLGVYVTTLVWTVSLVQEEVFGQCAPNTPQASAILFGVPAVLSAWVLSKFNGEHVERASGVSLFAVGWCVANAMITSLISLALIVKCQAWRYTIPRGWSWVLGDLSGHTLDRITWVILMLSTFCNLSLIIIMVIARIGRYAVRRDGTVDKLETISLYRKGK